MTYQNSSSDINHQTTSPSSSSLGLLDTFPSEIRDKIYALVFHAGHISLTRASKALHEDTKDALLRHGIYRLNIQYWSDPKVYCWTVACEIPTCLLADVQNLRINIDLRTPFDRERPQYLPSENLEDDHVVYYHQALWTLGPESSASLLPDTKAVNFQNYGLWTLWSPALKLILEKLTGTMKRHNYCEITHQYSSSYGIPSTAHDALELFQSFKTVSVQFTYAVTFAVEAMRNYLECDTSIEANHERTMKALGPGQGLEKEPDLTITQRVSYMHEWKTLKFWGDEPDDKDYGLGEWTAKGGRVWPIRNP